MRTSARRRNRALVAAGLTAAGLLATAATTMAKPLGDADVASRDPIPAAQADPLDPVGSGHRWVAAELGEVRPVQPLDPIEQMTADARQVFAVYDGVEFVEPAKDPLAIGFHEAGGSHPALTPVGALLGNDNPGGTGDLVDDPEGARVRVMPSRGRGGSGTSAVDVALTPDTVVRSVVTGTVTAIQDYSLYGSMTDQLLEIQPTGRPDLRVVLYHLRDVQVSVGDEVFAGLTPIANGARELPVTNQVDRFAEGTCPCPHVDIRVRRV